MHLWFQSEHSLCGKACTCGHCNFSPFFLAKLCYLLWGLFWKVLFKRPQILCWTEVHTLTQPSRICMFLSSNNLYFSWLLRVVILLQNKCSLKLYFYCKWGENVSYRISWYCCCILVTFYLYKQPRSNNLFPLDHGVSHTFFGKL